MGYNQRPSSQIENRRRRFAYNVEETDGQAGYMSKLEWMATTMRSIWIRNEYVFENKLSTPSTIKQAVNEMLRNFKSAREEEKEVVGTRENSNTMWLRLVNNYININWDVAIDNTTKQGGFGIVARNQEGELLATVCYKQSNVHPPKLAESLSQLRAIKFYQDFAYQHIILEGNALLIIQAVTSAETSMS